MAKPIVLLGLILVALVAVGLSIGVAVAKESKEDKTAAKQEKKCDKLEKKNDKREAKGKDPKPLPDYCGFQGQVFEFPDLGATVTVQAPESVTVTAVPSTDPTAIDPERDGAWGSIGKFFNFEASGPFDLAKIEVSYDPTTLFSYVSEDSLKLKFWDPSISDWAHPIDSGVDTTNHIVWAIVDHFSEYAPIGDGFPAYANNFEFTRASKPELPLGIYYKNNFESWNADDIDVIPYNTRSAETWPGSPTQTYSLNFDPKLLFDPETGGKWFETLISDVNGSTTYTLTSYVKYNKLSSNDDYGILYYYEYDAGMVDLPQSGDFVFFDATHAWSPRDYITVNYANIGNGWMKIDTTLTTAPEAAHIKFAIMNYALDFNIAVLDTYLIDDLSLLVT